MRWVLYPIAALFALAVLGIATLAAMAFFAWPKLPALDTLTDYRPRVPLRVYTADGHLIGEFGEERRDVVRIAEVPSHLKHAILAAEDERFYEHRGIDPVGLARAALANLSSGGRGQGASTITMQVARNFFLSREKTYNRKLYEILLALKIEQNLSKDQILELYINQIFLGQRAYGFAAAARAYYGKTLDELSLPEAAMLAGLPKAPSAFNPIVNPARAAVRQQYVLRRMLEAGFIAPQQYEEALVFATPKQSQRDIAAARRVPDIVVPGDYVAEMARQIAVEQFGEQAYELGLRIVTTVTRKDQEAAYAALRRGVFDYDRRHGYRGPEAFVDLPSGRVADEQLDEALGDSSDHDDLLAALVLKAGPKEVLVYRRGQEIRITGKGLSFVAPMLSEKAPQARRVRRGAIVRVRNAGKDSWELTQLPDVQAALVAIDSHSGAVRALIGGFDFNRNKFNHVTQAVRQPGSSFKPFIFSAALDREFGPGSVLEDNPLYYPAGVTGSKAWEPKNYDGRYSGPMTLRDGLARSKNMVSIRLLEKITPEYARDYLGRFGFDPAQNPPYLTMALGAGAATPWQMAAGYAVFANGGYRVEPFVIKEMYDGSGRLIARTDPPVAGQSAPRVIDARNAWLMDSMMRDVVQRGTATRARSLKREDLAGKTGTTNDYVDAWFCGYHPDLVAVSWVGHSQPRNLGKGETGGAAALPIWINYMASALEGVPQVELPRPDGLRQVQNGLGTRQDWQYAEYAPPAPPPVPDWLREMFANDGAPAMEAEAEAIPPGPAPLILPPPSPARAQAPAPVEERRPTPIRP
ncbi:penicillin-binding protein 1A [Thauera phenylacetica]|jgi:penicillin-binding protein 1A|uniref:Penicillin-binding protein 1A n=1 Tax=Thauera phenylacetica B4P TaxID=1234382 RepID=N6YW73_9RHOO|nr:PBP1A family penicillin-binding protein [Thauera phenylacetica]ENO98501.1 penicillin-binding protein, 1A family [Thauera phenylacetica B4P]